MCQPYFILIHKHAKLLFQVVTSFFLQTLQVINYHLQSADILDVEMVQYIQKTIKKYSVSQKIVFEILETEGIENYEEVSDFIRKMKTLGCKISIDDFGAGYSNFEHILKLDADYIKIDGSLIKNLETDHNSRVVVETVVDFAKKLNLVTVAEFVHNQGVFEIVKSLGIERTQGFYLAEPEREIPQNY